MNIDSIHNGVVIDHITAGAGMRLYHLLELGKLDCSVAIIKNAQSHKRGKKDIIKINADNPVNHDIIGSVDPAATINIIKVGQLAEKRDNKMPMRLKNVIHCKNPRCITSTEQEIDHIFKLVDLENKTYRCMYCEAKSQ